MKNTKDSDLRDAISLEELYELLKDKNININVLGGIKMDVENAGFSVTQTVSGNNYGSLNAAKGNIYSTNNAGNNEAENIIDLVKSLKGLINNEELNEVNKDDKESVIDDLDTIEEQINSDSTKTVKLKKAYEGIKSFISKIPSALTTGTLIATKAEELYEKLKPMIEQQTYSALQIY
eukprot:TRINITY_DN703_c0_g1_i3.p3 TRINITY_DN703_c0_g1~~TRINITY_DN703_c0_g1_i3.p3  ORF type:complete len:178 (-),score=26.03 TRINITY_DN703_c0_g1_i3:448-981(-)